MSDANDRRMTFKNLFIRHYRTERERSEKCIGEIMDILEETDNTECQTIDLILGRIIQHYDRK